MVEHSMAGHFWPMGAPYSFVSVGHQGQYAVSWEIVLTNTVHLYTVDTDTHYSNEEQCT